MNPPRVTREACQENCQDDDKCDTFLFHHCFGICKKYASRWKPSASVDPCCDVYQKVTTILPNSSNAATLLLLCVCLYAIAGLAAGYAKEGRPQHIHHSQLRQEYGLCLDGLAFVKHGGSKAVRTPSEPQNSSPLLFGPGKDRSSSVRPGPAEGTESRGKKDRSPKAKASKSKSEKQAKSPESAEPQVGGSTSVATVARPTTTAERALHEHREHGELHSSQAKIKVLGLQASAAI